MRIAEPSAYIFTKVDKVERAFKNISQQITVKCRALFFKLLIYMKIIYISMQNNGDF